MFLNRGDHTFSEISQFSNTYASEWSWATMFMDVDLDGHEDILITTGHMYDVQDSDALARQTDALQRINSFDVYKRMIFDFPTLELKNVAFKNKGGLKFETVSNGWGLGNQKDISHGMATADLDNDGDLDIVINRLNQNVGLFSAGNSLNASKIAGDLTETNARVISSVEETSKYKFIPEKDLFDVEYWSLEQAKIKKTKKLLEGNVVVITGSAGVIGSATYKLFKSYGAEIVLLDYNLKKINEIQKNVKDLCIHCDVTNKNSISKAFKKICENYGGIDILISNAGTAIGGSIAEVDDKILRKSFEENFFSHQNCASEAIKIMKKQNINGCLLFNISKQSVNPGKNFGPYGLPKSALLSLCKQYALDYGSYGIRSNGVNADRIRSGLLNENMIKSRAKAREVSTEDYMKGNLLLNEVKAEDVAKAFFHLAISKKTTGAVLTVDGGNIAASLR